jgi:hypothetical protein
VRIAWAKSKQIGHTPSRNDRPVTGVVYRALFPSMGRRAIPSFGCLFVTPDSSPVYEAFGCC